eukprot:4450939-Pleurochrysis_carterae.AAC.1
MLRRVTEGQFDAVFAAPQCASFSVAHAPKLRSRSSPEGIRPTPARWKRFLEKHNALADVAASLSEAAHAVGAVWMIENPADCGDEGGAA